MGSVFSRAKIILGAVFLLNKALDTLNKRLKESPGLPVPNPTTPLWTIPKAPISSEGKALPSYADVIVIGSGITGASVAYHALKRDAGLRVVIVEAREVCSGATGRNGGHINPPLFDDWKNNKELYGEEDAKRLVKFRLAHVQEMQAIAREEGIVAESQVRVTEHLEAYTDVEDFEEARDKFLAWQEAMPDESAPFEAHDCAATMKKFGVADHVKGCVAGPGGAMHPYRFVTSLLHKLLLRHPDTFFVATQTPCTAVNPPSPTNPFYTVITSRGSIAAPHVVHATNGWVSHLLVPMREKVIPARGTMSAQRPGASLSPSTRDGFRSFVFHPGGLGYDYLTQLPTGEHELMFGGGWASAFDAAFSDIGKSDDSEFSVPVAGHLAGALPLYFGLKNWGKEATVAKRQKGEYEWDEGRTKAQWSGILGISADGLPWVGRLPSKISGRATPQPLLNGSLAYSTVSEKDQLRLATSMVSQRLALPGEWISAGYTGEGMVHAWMCGKALAAMLQDAESELEEWFPKMLRVTEERWKKANLEDFIMRKVRT